MSDDIKDDNDDGLPPALKELMEALTSGQVAGKIKVVKMSDMVGGSAEITPEKMMELLKSISGQGSVSGLMMGPPQRAQPDYGIVINGSASFEPGTGQCSRDPSKLVPVLDCTIPTQNGTKKVMIEFEEPVGLSKLMEALQTMIIGYAFSNHNEMRSVLDTERAKMDAEKKDAGERPN